MFGSTREQMKQVPPVRKKDDKNGKHKILCITNTEDVSGMPLCEQGKQLGGRVDLVGPGVGVYVSVI